jgi:hypothetical protein
MRFPPSERPNSWQRPVLGMASVAFGMIMREVANRRRTAHRAQPATPEPPRQDDPAAAPEVVIRMVQPQPRRPLPPVRANGITWGRWSTYLLARLLLVALTVALLEISSTSQQPSLRYLAVVLTIGALLIPYRSPRDRRNQDNIGGIVTMCGALLAVAIWPWYLYTTATAPVTPVTVIATKSFSLSPGFVGRGCIGLRDSQQHLWLISQDVGGSIRNDRIVLYQTSFGWTADSNPTQSPSPLFDTPHLNQVAYSLTPATNRAPFCTVYNSSGGS